MSKGIFYRNTKTFTLYLKHVRYCSTTSINRSNFQSYSQQNTGKTALNKVRGSNELKTIRKQIYECEAAQTIVDIIKNHIQTRSAMNAIDKSVFGSAMQQCGKLKEWKLALEIFNLMIKYNAVQTHIEYNILMDVLCKNDQIHVALKLFHDRQNTAHIQWDISIFNCLINGCKHRSNVQIAEKLWKQLHSIHLQADLVTFNSMITVYARSGLMHKALHLWDIMLGNKKETNISPDSVTCATMMNACAVHKNRHKMMEIQHYMEQHNIVLETVHYSAMMKCYLIDKQPLDALDFFNHEIKQKLSKKQIANNKVLVHQLCCTYLQLMEINSTNSIADIKQYFIMITKKIPKEYGILPFNGLLFDALLLMNRDWKQMMHDFEKAVVKKEIDGYWKKSEFDEWWIDFHRHSKITARFILNYVFCYSKNERNYIQNEIIHKGKNVVILCGNKNHSEGKHIDSKQDDDCMKEMLQKELLSWHPPINSCQYDKESACLLLYARDVRSFLFSLPAL